MSERVRVVAPEGGRRMTKQSELDSTDINRIVNRWRQTGVMPTGAVNPQYGDFSGVEDFHASLNKVRSAERDFLTLPARIRAYCQNDPGEYLDLCLNPERREECEKLGLKEAQLPEKALLVRLEEKKVEIAEKSPQE